MAHRIAWNKKPIQFYVDENNCFVVTSHSCGSPGYPRIWKDGVSITLNRHIWNECFGEIPEGMLVCHTCDNRGCINPEHLKINGWDKFLGTHQDNDSDRERKGRTACKEKPVMKKNVRLDIMVDRSELERLDRLAEIWGMNRSEKVRDLIRKGKTPDEEKQLNEGLDKALDNLRFLTDKMHKQDEQLEAHKGIISELIGFIKNKAEACNKNPEEWFSELRAVVNEKYPQENFMMIGS